MIHLLSISSWLLLACSVCWGDPDSNMSKGAAAGVLFMVGVIVSVLTWISGTTFYFVRRARRLEGSVESPIPGDPRAL